MPGAAMGGGHRRAHMEGINGDGKPAADDKRCTLAPRVAGWNNVVVTHRGRTRHVAIERVADRLTEALGSVLVKLRGC